MKSISVEEMRMLDQRTINEAGISGRILMERAGLGVAAEIDEFVQQLPARHRRRIVVLCGKGNNGGDGYVLAQALSKTYAVIVYSVCAIEELAGDASYYAKELISANKISVIQKQHLSQEDFLQGDIVVDAMLGTGAKGALRSPFDQWITLLNSTGLPVVAVDIPSGLDGDSGEVESSAVVADMTVTIGFPKNGMFLNKGLGVCGRIRVIDIGIPVVYSNELINAREITMNSDVRVLLQRLPRNSHKGMNGRVVTIGGSSLYKGAPFLAAKSALRSGAGLSVVCVPETADISNSTCHSLIVEEVSDSGRGVFSADSLDELGTAISNADSLVVGPGLTVNDDLIPVIEYVCGIDKPVVLDADALNIIAGNPAIYRKELTAVLTPHPGEMKRLLKGFGLEELLSKSRLDQAVALSRELDAVVVLKGHRTVVASPDGRYSINGSGTAALATAGSGDVLSGIVAAFLAHGLDLYDSARAGCFIHGLASELFCGAERGLTADELVDLISVALKYVSPVA